MMYSDDVMLRNKIIDVMELWKSLCKMIVPNFIYNLPKNYSTGINCSLILKCQLLQIYNLTIPKKN
jgi:hypothetical protein